MAWTEISTVRTITQLDSDSYTDEEVQEFISNAQKEISSKLQVEVVRELVEYIDETRENDLDNDTTFYFKKWKGNYLGDRNYDGKVDTDDIIIYSVASDGTETELTATSVNPTNMSFTLSSSPGDVDLYVTYCYTPYDFVNPNSLVSLATAYLTSSYLKLTQNGGDGTGGDDSRSIRIGNLSIGAGKSSSAGWTYGKVNSFYDKYMELMAQLIENTTGGALVGESFVQI